MLTHRDLRQFTSIMLRRYARQTVDANASLMAPDDYRIAIAYFQLLSGLQLFREYKVWTSLTGESHWMDVVNELEPAHYDTIREVIDTKGAAIKTLNATPQKQLKTSLDSCVARLFSV